ncbi:MAG: hypothetical protein RLY78_3671 [Pseudomonadota bacterium]|jgi:hypothetical protein|uniref:Uncharacterized protein n=1 Tax=Pseudaquabacterium rugosum TaxID=2984194 RepID=A0ABU9BFV7_9BURK
MALPALTSMTRWLRQRGRGQVRTPEPADLGTAFGMECWLDESAPAPLGASAPADKPAGRRWWPGRRQGSGQR